MRNEITVSGDSYIDKKIVSGTVFMVQSLDGDELQYDKLDATLDLCSIIPTLFKPKNADGLLTSESELFGVRPRISILVADPSAYKTGAVVLYKHNGALVGKYYMANIKRVGKTQYRIDCVSPVGMLAKSQHYGGIYSGTPLSELVSDIIGGAVPFSVATDLADQAVYGWLPVASRRDNLHQVLFAMGCAAQKDENGDLYIAPLFDDEYMVLPEDRIYTGGSVRYPKASTRVSIIEHAYIATVSDEATTLFEGDVPADPITAPSGAAINGALVLFNGPMHDLVIENGTILESGVNYAVLGPAGGCKLTGQAYTHTTREIIRPETATNDTDNTYRVENATLVSVINSENVATRVASYYGSAKTISAGIVVDAERAGSVVQFNDPFGDQTKGIIASMDINMSNKLKANAEIVADYSPGSAGNFYTNFAILTASGSWAVPDGVTKIRVVLIGGGGGGEAGQAGEDGTKGSQNSYGTSGAGGAAGAGGSPGKVYIATIPVTAGQSLSVVIGAGGFGAEFGGSPGKGGASKIGAYSSDDGFTPSNGGYVGLLADDVYALPGVSGIAGGGGQPNYSTRPPVTYNGQTWSAGTPGEKVTDDDGYIVSGGLGGGAAVGADGGDGEDGTSSWGTLIAGAGGPGATPVAADNATVPGSGGMGGHGGGGGGGGGGTSDGWGNDGSGGSGGNGGKGGDGAPGIVLIYY